MSTYQIKYEIDSPETEAKAVQDIKQYLNDGALWDRLLAVTSIQIANKANMNQIAFTCSLIGITGYPVTALVQYICGLTKHEMPQWMEED